MSENKISKKNTRYRFLMIFSTFAVIAGGLSSGFVSAVAKNEKVRSKDDYTHQLQKRAQTSSAYFKREVDSQTAGKIGDMVTPDDRKLIRHLDEVNPYLINAFLAGEDRYFYDHNGVAPYSIMRAAYQQLLDDDVTTGGSTITQQLIKNEILQNNEKTYRRKVLEILNALRIERYYTKDEILAAYMNSVYFGKGHHRHMYGVASASQGIFNKDVRDLLLPEAAYLAGMVQRPNAYIPFGPHSQQNLHRGIQRMKLILGQMLKYHFITVQKYNEAITYNIENALAKESSYTNDFEKYPFIINAVEREAIEVLQNLKYNKEGVHDSYRDLVRNGGLCIHTTLDQKMYDQMNDALQKINFPKKRMAGKACTEQLGAVLMENKTGAILSFYGGTNFKENEKDHAFETKRQPGSSIKPLLAYGPAINEGLISTQSVIVDEPLTKAHSTQVYVNANKGYAGPKSVAYALQWSLNIPAVKVFRRLGIQRGFDYLRQMGLSPHQWDGEASVLGGMTNGYTVKQMTAAYAMIANDGIYNHPHLIERITTSSGEEIYNYSAIHQPKRIFTTQTTSQLTEMLRAVVKNGTARSIGNQLSRYSIAGKTGTTSNETDFWFIGYTPDISLGVWSGYDYITKATDLAKSAWIKLFRAAAAAQPERIPAGRAFHPLHTEEENLGER